MIEILKEGRLLVAAPELMDPNFFQTVVLICHHSERDGTIGLVLNRCTEMSIGKALGDLPAAADRTEPMWLGGPVDTRNVWILHRRQDLISPGHEVQEGVFFTADAGVVKKILRTNGPDPDGSIFRLFVGYAGWSSGQVEREMEEGAWDVISAGPECLFSNAPDRLWREMSVRVLLPQPLDARRIRDAWMN